MKARTLTLVAAVLIGIVAARSQNMLGVSGLINTPSAEMHAEGDAQIGVYYLDNHITPDVPWKYKTGNMYLSITPFWWVELGYTMTLMRDDQGRLANKDRQLQLKLNPLREGKYWPAIALGGNDVIGSDFKFRESDKGPSYFTNLYVAATKHFNIVGQELGVNVAYRYYTRSTNRKWRGVVGGITIRPSFYRPLRFVAEYTGREVNIGLDCLLFKHLFLQAVLTDCKYFSGGLAFRCNLF